MAGRRVYGGVNGGVGGGGGGGGLNPSVMAQSHGQRDHSLFLSAASSPSPFLGTSSMVSFVDVKRSNGLNRSMLHEENCDDDFEEYLHQPEKKRRLTVDQVQYLEKSFEVENKLEPERKIQLASELGLQPRQVAIWFQNRRARWKTKQLEKDYDILQASYESLKSDYENLAKEKDKLKVEITLLTDKLNRKDEDQKRNSDSTNTDRPSAEPPPSSPPPANPVADSASEGEVSKPFVLRKQEGISSTKSHIFDCYRPHYAPGIPSTLLEGDAGDSSFAFEHEHSDLSQDEEEGLNRALFQSYLFPKLEDVDYPDPPTSSCSFSFAVEDHADHAFWSWSY